MRKFLLTGLSAFLVAPLAVLLSLSNARCDEGDDALAAFRSENYPRALQLARPAAEAENFLAQFTLGRIYTEGKGTSPNKNEGAKWFRKALSQAEPAAQNGDPRAQYVLGRMYDEGWVLTKNTDQAIIWYRKAADHGYAAAQHTLAGMYGRGEGVPKNYKEAVAWHRKAAEQGDANAQFFLGWMYAQGQGVAKNETEADSWLRKAANQGYAAAQYDLAASYAQGGHGIAKNDTEAVSWLRKAAKQGYAAAQYNLAGMYHDGLGVAKNDNEAISWLRKAAEQGHVDAQGILRKLGKSYKNTPGAPPRPQPTPNAPNAVSKKDIQDMIQAAMKEAAGGAVRPPKTVHSDVDKPGYAVPENPDNFAVVIGVEKYASLPVADFSERDAEAVRAHLMALGYPPRNIYFLSGHQATRAKIAQSMNTWLPKRVSENSTVFFYYSGHGAPDPQTNQAYLVPIDGDAEDLESTAYPIQQLYEKLSKLKARQVIVALDSCFSGTGGRSVLAKGTRPLVGKVDLGGVPDNVIAMTASDKSQISGTIEEQGHGAFTYYMLKGLTGAAKNASGTVTMLSLYDYLTPKVQDAARLHNRDQTPQLLPRSGEKVEIRLR